jgi:hypothetical protein
MRIITFGNLLIKMARKIGIWKVKMYMLKWNIFISVSLLYFRLQLWQPQCYVAWTIYCADTTITSSLLQFSPLFKNKVSADVAGFYSNVSCEIFLYIPQLLQANSGIASKFGPRLFLSTSSLIHYSLSIPSLDAEWERLTESAVKQSIHRCLTCFRHHLHVTGT